MKTIIHSIFFRAMRTLFFILISLLITQGKSNMASPVLPGTQMASPFISKFVDITHEKIEIVLDSTFETALFKIEYHISAHKSGSQIPLMFYAIDYKEGFKIWIDGVETQIQELPKRYEELEGTSFTDFNYLFGEQNRGSSKSLEIKSSKSSTKFISVNELKYFTADVSEGKHLIQVEYTALHWTDLRDWVKEFSFQYALSPANYWKSFGSLEISIDASKFKQNITTNLGESATGNDQEIARWTFDKLPNEILSISYKPGISPKAQQLIDISPNNIALIFGGILAFIHLLLVYFYRKSHPSKRFSWIVIVGSIFVPLLSLGAQMYSYIFIDNLIGEMASNFHGYTFLIFLIYPLVVPIYWLFMWVFDKSIKRRLQSN